MENEDLKLLTNTPICHHRGPPPDGIESFFHGSLSETWLLQGKGRWAWILRKEHVGNASMTWMRGVTRYACSEEFEPDQIMDVSGGITMAGLAHFHYNHGLYIEEGGLQKLLYMKLSEPPHHVNKVAMINTN